jgi:hypothetical protein
MQRITKYIPKSIKENIKLYQKLIRWKGKHRYFCISTQRTGTTSVGDFFEHFGFPTARWKDSRNSDWSKSWDDGDFESIFSSMMFRCNQVFEDSPWWHPEFYKFLYHRFPRSKFILFTRDSDSWFESMIKHSRGKNPGNTQRHCKIYRLEKEFYYRLDNDKTFKPSPNYSIDNLLDLKGRDDHYKQIYETRNREITEFFKQKNPESLFTCKLEDPMKWVKLGEFIGLKVPSDFIIHSNRSKGSRVKQDSTSRILLNEQ